MHYDNSLLCLHLEYLEGCGSKFEIDESNCFSDIIAWMTTSNIRSIFATRITEPLSKVHDSWFNVMHNHVHRPKANPSNIQTKEKKLYNYKLLSVTPVQI